MRSLVTAPVPSIGAPTSLLRISSLSAYRLAPLEGCPDSECPSLADAILFDQH
jgi:hypothetical protein